MASNPITPTKIPPAINPRDSEFMWRVVQNLGPNPVIDWHTVAAEMGLKSAGVAKVRFGQIKKKFINASLGNDESVIGSSTTATPTKVRKPRAPAVTPKTPKILRKKAAEEDEKKETKLEYLPDHEYYEDLAEEHEKKETKLNDLPEFEYLEDLAEEHEKKETKLNALPENEYLEDLEDEDASPFDYQYVEAQHLLGRS